MGRLQPQSNGPLDSNTVMGTQAVDAWAVTFGTARRDLAPPSPLLAVPNVIAHHQRPVYRLHIIRCAHWTVNLYGFLYHAFVALIPPHCGEEKGRWNIYLLASSGHRAAEN